MSASWDPTWEDVFRSQPWGQYAPEYVIRLVARAYYARDRKSVRFLDLGCGPGACTWYLAREGFQVSGIDGSETAVRLAGDRLARESLAADLRCGDYVSLPWEAGSFDAVLDNATLYCNRFAECKRTVAEVSRVLKPGGHFFSCNFTQATWGHGTGERVERNGFRAIPDGPLAGKGFALFMDREQLDELYADFAEVRVEQVRWTLGGMAQCVELWVVDAIKAADADPVARRGSAG